MSAGIVTVNVSGGDTDLVDAPGVNSFIRVLHYHITSDRPVISTFKSNTSAIDICYATMASGGGISTPYADGGVMACNPGEKLVLSLGSVANVGGVVVYVVKPGAFPSNV